MVCYEFHSNLLIFLTNEGPFSGHSSMKIIFPQYSFKYLRINFFMHITFYFCSQLCHPQFCINFPLSQKPLFVTCCNNFLGACPYSAGSLFSFLYPSITCWTVEWLLWIISAISLSNFLPLKWFNYQLTSLQCCMSTHSQYFNAIWTPTANTWSTNPVFH